MTADNEQAKSLWEAQKQWKNLTNPLTHDPEIHSQINNLLNWNFRKEKGVPKGTYEPEINFQGFDKFEDFPEKRKMGHCEISTNTSWKREVTIINGKEVEGSETKIYEATMSIFLNQKYLSNKLGMNEFISNYEENGLNIRWWNTLSIGFEELIATIAHEPVHAFQTTINLNEDKKSECESSGERDTNGNLLYPELAAEHTALTEEIKQMIESSAEYQEFKEFWKEGKIVTKKNQNQGVDSNSFQLLSDKFKDKVNETGDASVKGVKKAGAGLEKAGKSLEGAADNKQWPRWVLPRNRLRSSAFDRNNCFGV